MTEPIKTLSDVEALAAAAGITFTPEEYAAGQSLADQRRAQIEAENATEQSTGFKAVIERFNALYPKFLQSIMSIGDLLMSAVRTIAIAFGIPLALLVAIIIEQQRVSYGAQLFEIHGALAQLGALLLVLANFILELTINWIEHEAGYSEPRRNEFSLRLWGQRIAYIMGRESDWEPRQKSPALRYRAALRLIAGTILGLALAGSMQSVIAGLNGNWLTALGKVITDSTLIQMVTWINGLAFALTVVTITQVFSHFIAVKVTQVMAIMQSSATDKEQKAAAAAGLSFALYMFGRLKERQRNRRMQPAVSAADLPSMSGELSGTIPVPNVLTVPEQTGVSVAMDVTNGQKRANRTKIDTALDLLLTDRTLRNLTTRELEEKTGIGRNTWATAKKRIGL